MQGGYISLKKVFWFPEFTRTLSSSYIEPETTTYFVLAIFHCTVGRSVQHRVWRLEKSLHADLGMVASSATPSMAIAPSSAVDDVSVRTA